MPNIKGNSAADISAVDISAVDISVVDISVANISSACIYRVTFKEWPPIVLV